MDKKIEILLGSYKNIASVNVDSYDKIELTNKESELNEFTVNDVVNSTDVFDNERNANQNYRIYGRIEFLSLLNGLINNQSNNNDNYRYLENFFTPVYSGASKNIMNCFSFYLVKPASTIYPKINNTNNYRRYFQVIATPNDFELFPAGFSNNVFGEQEYSFSFNKDFDVSQYFDYFGFPLTELFLFARYNPSNNGWGVPETMEFSNWNSNGTLSKLNFPITPLNNGDYVKTGTGNKIGDLINYNKKEFTQTQLSGQTIYVSTSYRDGATTKKIVWKYNPFIPFRLRYFGDELNEANTGSTSYDIVNSIPEYATLLDNKGNYVWRDILPQGYVEPLTGVGVNYPFFNGRRYLFESIIISMSPDLSDLSTKEIFNLISYSQNTTNIDTTPLNDLNNIGKPCQ